MKVVLIAGETSGDLIGAEIASEFAKNGIEVLGVGGENMLKSGLKISFFEMSEISLMGFAEIVPKILKMKKLIKGTAEKILDINPEYVITIDSPGFNLRLVKLLRKADFKGKIYHAIAPTVWAYKPERSKVFASVFDKLFCILPFEPPFFKKDGLDAEFICYPPLLRLKKLMPEMENFPKEYILFNIGSRNVEVKNNLKFALNVISLIKKEIPDAKFVFQTFPQFEKIIKEKFPNEIVVSGSEDKLFYLKRAKFSISKSGTGAMEISLLGIPSVVFYNANPLSVLIMKLLAKIKFMHLVNIILNRGVIPEFVQPKNNPEIFVKKIIEILQNPNLVKLQKENISEVKKILENSNYNSFGEGVFKNL
jgi:lipid-A-disaccharide synthase